MNTDDVKSALASKTVWGAVIAAAAIALNWWKGVTIDPATQAQIVDTLVNGIATVTGLVGTALAIWGRIVATKKIG